jgi:serine/threonine kinase 32
MGDACSKAQSGEGGSLPLISMNHFKQLYAIGRGGFGKVWRVESKKEREQYAMKEMAKARIITKKSVSSVINELELLTMV